ncbi:MAG: hypothetical protein ABR575_07105 [Actinomycetota bacterium]
MAAFVMSCLYELYRATVKRGTSRHDSMDSFVKNNVVFYAIAAVVIAFLFAGYDWSVWIGLAFAGGSILASIVYYNPRILLERDPKTIDWFEDILFTGLLSAAAVLLIYAATDVTLRP